MKQPAQTAVGWSLSAGGGWQRGVADVVWVLAVLEWRGLGCGVSHGCDHPNQDHQQNWTGQRNTMAFLK